MNQDGFIYCRSHCPWAILKVLFQSLQEGLFSSLLPQVGMEFTTIDEAWMFWISYGGQKGFEEQETIQVTGDDGATVQMSSLFEEGIFEQYMAINTFSELLTGSMTHGVIGEF
ncbi:uncharacterized protein [Miscanthus floridulus]|uniref:uncharacterized protein isoform X1 n=1 Tax=Miscanthus floridulus TaxID=154761 RepID=UPI0034586F5C